MVLGMVFFGLGILSAFLRMFPQVLPNFPQVPLENDFSASKKDFPRQGSNYNFLAIFPRSAAEGLSQCSQNRPLQHRERFFKSGLEQRVVPFSFPSASNSLVPSADRIFLCSTGKDSFTSWDA